MILFSVRFRLFALCAGLLLILGGTNLLLGSIVHKQSVTQVSFREQMRRVQVMNATLQAVNNFRYRVGQINTARLLKVDRDVADNTQLLTDANRELTERIEQLRSFDPVTAQTVVDCLARLPAATQQFSDGMVAKNIELARSGYVAGTAATDLIRTSLLTAIAREEQIAKESGDQVRNLAAAAIRWTTVIVLGSGLISFAFTGFLLSTIVRPLKATVASLKQLNSGLTDIDLPPITRDEFGDMAVALRQFREQSERLRRVAYRDSLTGLGSRLHLDETLRALVIEHANLKRKIAVLYVDLDNFSAVNDSLGHSAGDRYLAEAALRLQRFAPEDSLVCRYSGDKFVILIQDLGPASGDARGYLQDAASQLLRGLSEPFPYGTHLLPMSVSIGVAQYPDDGQNAEQILSNADAAMYRAKQAGRNGVQFATAELAASMRQRLTVATDVRRGVENKEFEPFYQPIVDTTSGLIVGAEALVRWRHPLRGVLSAYEFVEIAEATGTIRNIGEHCLRRCFAQAQQWAVRGRPLRIAVNLSVRQIDDGSVLDLLRTMAAKPGLPNIGLDLEITESAMLEHLDRAQETLRQIKLLGHRLSVDDFGTGYSSLTYVQRFPIDKIKIDRSFVMKMDTSREAQAIIAATVALAKSLSLEVIAEGVETAEQARLLTGLGCVLQQGFYYSMALPVADFEAWVDAYHPQLAS